jgi:hypothetical protein
MKAPALAEAACEKAAAPDAAVKRHRSARAASLSGREASPDVVPQALAEAGSLLARGARGSDAGSRRNATASDVTPKVPPLLRALLARDAAGEALALKMLLAASPGLMPKGPAGSLAVAAASGAAGGPRPSQFGGPVFATLREMLRRGCTADATEALHVVLRALPIEDDLDDADDRTLLLVRSLLKAGADAAAPVPGVGGHRGERMCVLSLVGDTKIAEELASSASLDHSWKLSQMVRVPLQQSLDHLTFLRDFYGDRLFRVDEIERLLDGAMRCDDPFERNRLDALESLHYELLRSGGSLRCLRDMKHAATVSWNLRSFKSILERLCETLSRRWTRFGNSASVLGPMTCCVKHLLESEMERQLQEPAGAKQGVAAEDAPDDLSAVRDYGAPAEGRIWLEHHKKPCTAEQAADEHAFLRLILDAGARLPRGADDLPLAASMLIGPVAGALRGGSDATQPMRELLTTLHASAGDPHEPVVSAERWQAVGAAVQAALDAHSTLDAATARTARAADRSDAACVSNWAAMRALVTDMEAAACRDDVQAANTAATSLQPYRATLHIAAGRRAVAENAASKRARLTAAIATAMQTAPAGVDAKPLKESTPDAEVLHLRAACGESVPVPRALATRTSEVLAAMTARWAACEQGQPLYVAELTADQLQYFSAFIAESDLADHAHDGAWEAATRAAPSSVDWAALESAAERAVGATLLVSREQRLRRLLQAVVAAGALGSSRMQLAMALATTARLRNDTCCKRKSAY